MSHLGKENPLSAPSTDSSPSSPLLFASLLSTITNIASQASSYKEEMKMNGQRERERERATLTQSSVHVSGVCMGHSLRLQCSLIPQLSLPFLYVQFLCLWVLLSVQHFWFVFPITFSRFLWNFPLSLPLTSFWSCWTMQCCNRLALCNSTGGWESRVGVQSVEITLYFWPLPAITTRSHPSESSKSCKQPLGWQK